MKQKRSAHPIRSTALGVLAVVVINVIGAAIITTWILKGGLSADAPGYLAPGILFISMLICTLTATKSAEKNRGMIISLFMVAAVLVVLATVNFALYEGEFGGILPVLITTILGGTCGFLGSAFTPKRKMRKKHYR